MRRILLLILCAFSLWGCDSRPNAQKQMPRLAPPPDVKPPPALSIGVTIDGVPGPTVDVTLLGKTKPDFVDEERQVWRLANLVALPADRQATHYRVAGASQASIDLLPPAKAGAPEPVLVLTRRSEVIATFVDPATPFPDFHGQGGRRSRPGDAFPRVTGVTSIAIETAPR